MAQNSYQFFKKIGKNISWLTAEKLCRGVVQILIAILLTRQLGPESFGYFTYSQSLAALFLPLIVMGLNNLLIYELVNEEVTKNKIINSALFLKLTGWVLSVFLFFLIHFIFDFKISSALALIFLFGMVFRVGDAFEFWFYAKENFQTSVKIKILASLLTLTALITYLFLDVINLNIIACIVFSEWAIYTAISFFVTLRSGFRPQFFSSINKDTLKLFKKSFPLIIQSAIIILYMRIDQIMLGHLSSQSEVGFYSAATKILEATYQLPPLILLALFPQWIKKNKNDPQSPMTYKLFGSLFILALCLAAAISFLAPWGIPLLFGSEYERSATILSIHAWVIPFVFFGTTRSQWLVSIGDTLSNLAVQVPAVGLSILLNLLLIPEYGAIGASVGTLIMAVLSNMFGCLLAKRIRESFTLLYKGLITLIFRKSS